MLNKDTQEVLKAYSSISNSCIIQPVTVFVDEYKQVISNVELEKVDEKINEEIGIYDLSNFLNAISLVNEPEIEYDTESRIVKISNQNTEIEYLTSDPDILGKDEIEKYKRVIESTIKAPSVLEFNLSKDTINQIKKAKGVFGDFDTVFLKNTNSTNSFIVEVGIWETFSAKHNTVKFKVETDINNNQEFEVGIPIDSILKIPVTDYQCSVKYNEKRDEYRVTLQNGISKAVLAVKSH